MRRQKKTPVAQGLLFFGDSTRIPSGSPSHESRNFGDRRVTLGDRRAISECGHTTTGVFSTSQPVIPWHCRPGTTTALEITTPKLTLSIRKAIADPFRTAPLGRSELPRIASPELPRCRTGGTEHRRWSTEVPNARAWAATWPSHDPRPWRVDDQLGGTSLEIRARGMHVGSSGNS